MKWLAKELNKEEGKPDDWYGISKTDFAHNYGSHLLTKYQYSTFKLFSTLYPNSEWIQWGFAKSTSGFWDDPKNLLGYMDWLGNKLGFMDREAWYEVTHNDIADNFGASLLKSHYNNSPANLVMGVYKDYEWLPWKFTSTPSHYWDELKHRQTYVEWLKKTVGVADESELKAHHFTENHGSGLLAHYSNSPSAVIQSLSAVEEPTPVIVKSTAPLDPESSKYYWRSKENQKKFVEVLGKLLGPSLI